MARKEKKPRGKFPLKSILANVFGTWTPPPYIRAIGRFFPWLGAKIADFVRARRKILRIVGIAVAVLAVAAIGFSAWYARQPRLQRVECSIIPPTPRYDDDEPVASLFLEFDGSVAKSEDAGNVVSSGITLDPSLDGVWEWTDDSHLQFTPSGDWPIGVSYRLSFAQDFFPDHVKVGRSYQFDTEPFAASISEGEFFIDPENGGIKRVLATVSANYPIDPASIEKAVVLRPSILAKSGTLENRAYQYSISYDKRRQNAYIVSEPLGVPVDTVSLSITVKKGLSSSLGGDATREDLETSVTIPGSSDYVRIDEVAHDLVKTDDQRYDQVVVVTTNSDISVDELAKNVSAWELPVDRPETPGLRAVKNYYWDDPEFVTDAILKVSRPIALEPLPNEKENNPVNSFRFKAEPGRYVFFRIKAGTRFYGDYYLKKENRTTFQVKRYPKEVSILSDGSIVSLTGSKQLAMLSREVGKVRFNVGRIRPDDINHLVSQSNGRLDSFSFDNWNFGEYNVTEQYAESRAVPLSGSGGVDYFSFDFSRYLERIPDKNLRYGLFVFTVQGDGSDVEDYRDRRLIMVTDLGFFVKTNADSTRDVFVQSIGSGDPVSDAEVSVLGLNGNVVASAVTGADGRVSLPNLSGFEREKRPVVYTVRKGEDLSFMPYGAEGRSLDYSSFDVGGITGAADPKTLTAFLFSDRGIYRPGDAMHFGLIVKAGDWKINLERTPLECKIVDPNGSEVSTQPITLGPDGFEELQFKTEDYSPTGEYVASVYLILDDPDKTRKFLGSETVKVEEFLPDSLTIKAAFDPAPQTGWIHPDKISAVVTLRNLFGTAAAGNDVKGQITLVPGTRRFAAWRDWKFSDPYAKENSYKEFLGTRQTDADGQCSFPIDVAKFEKATYNLRFYCEGFEKGGGRKVSQETSVYVSPLDYLVGYKADGDLGYINRDATRLVSLIAIGPNLEPVAVSDLTASLSEIRYVSMLVKQPNGVFKYQSVRKSYPVKTEPLALAKTGLTYSVPTATEGDFELTLVGKDGLTYNKIAWSVIGERNVERSLSRTAELEVKLDRQDYKNGDVIRLFIKAPYAGNGLITVERDRVYGHAWFKSTGSSSVQSIEVPTDLEGNGYVTVAFVRSVGSKEIFMNPLCYASVPFSVSRDKRTNRIKLGVSEEIKPGTDFEIAYSSDKPGKIVVAAVDEGILQVAGYRTPDPLSFFFRKRALEVGTAQIMDLILPEFNVLRSLGAMGGDDASEELNRNLNPFKRKRNAPVAYWSGIVETGPERRVLHYRVPDYFNGTIRVMAIAVSGDSIGAAEEKTVVKNTYVISPNVPLMAAPGDEFDVSVTVSNNKKGSGPTAVVSLRAIASKHLTLLSEATLKLDIPEGRDKTVSFRVKANDVPGGAELRFVASDPAGADSASLTETLSVRPAVPYRVTLSAGSMRKGDRRVPVSRRVYDDFATRSVSLSYVPLGLAKGLFFYLEKYPYGCSEQVTSATWPLLYPNLTRDLGINAEEARATVNRTISILQSRLKDDGNIGLWTSESETDPYLTNYCTLFLIEARNAGYYVGEGFFRSCLAGVRSIAEMDESGEYALANRAFAIYILTRNEVITTQYIESLKRDLRSEPDAETGYAGLFLAGSYSLLRKDLDAGLLIGKIRREFKPHESWRFSDSLCYKALYLDMVARHFPSKLSTVSADLLNDMAAELENQRFSTMSANYALMAIERYLSVTPGVASGSFGASESDADKASTALRLSGGPLFAGTFSAAAAEINLKNAEALNLFYQVTTAGFDLEPPKTETKDGIEVYREFTDASGAKVDSVKIGDEVYVKVNVRTTGKEIVNDVAVVDMLPAGLEADIASLRDPGDQTSWATSYIDVREDRVVFFGAVAPKLATFVYRARAVNSGKFVVPPLFAEAMYDKSTWAYRPQGPLTVKAK